MKRFSEQLHKQAATVKLQAAEKRELRERLVSYMEYHPLPADMKKAVLTKKQQKATLHSDAFAIFHIPFGQIFKTSVVAALIVLVVLPFAAEKAVPGDTLYAIKVQFNEEIRSTLTFDSYQKVEWETERLNRRIAEARLLASEGRLTEEVEAEVAEAVRTHTENAKREIEELRTQDADEATIASITLDTTLEVQSAALKGGESDPITGATTTMNTRSTNLIADAIDASRVETEGYNASSTPPAYNKLMARVEQNTTRVYELLDTIKGRVPAEELAEVTRRLEDIERSVQEAIENANAGGNTAQIQLISVLQRTQKLIMYMTELEVTATVDIETLVPVELTEAEEAILVAELTDELAQKVEQIIKMSTGVEEAGVIEKVDFTLAAIDEQSEKMASSSAEFAVFRPAADEALAMANDMIALLEQYYIPEIEPEDGVEVATTTPDGTEEAQATSTEEVVEEIIEEEVVEGEVTEGSDGEEGSEVPTEQVDSAEATTTTEASTTEPVDTI